MRVLVGVPMLAALFVALSAGTANAGYCGAASYSLCAGSNPGSYLWRAATVSHSDEVLPRGCLRPAAVHLLSYGLRHCL